MRLPAMRFKKHRFIGTSSVVRGGYIILKGIEKPW